MRVASAWAWLVVASTARQGNRGTPGLDSVDKWPGSSIPSPSNTKEACLGVCRFNPGWTVVPTRTWMASSRRALGLNTSTRDQPTDQVRVVLNGGSSNRGSVHHPIVMTPGDGSKFSHAGTKRDGHGVENGHRKATHSRRYPPSPFWDVDLSGPIYAFIGASFVILVLTYMALEEVGRM